jgi:hypothetical protein
MNSVASIEPRMVNLMADLARKLADKNYTEYFTIPQHPARVMRLTATLRIENSLIQYDELIVLHRSNRGVALAQVAVLQIERLGHSHHNPTITVQEPLSLTATDGSRSVLPSQVDQTYTDKYERTTQDSRRNQEPVQHKRDRRLKNI